MDCRRAVGGMNSALVVAGIEAGCLPGRIGDVERFIR